MFTRTLTTLRDLRSRPRSGSAPVTLARRSDRSQLLQHYRPLGTAMQRAHLLSTLARRESIAKNCNCVRYLLGSTLEALAGRSRSETNDRNDSGACKRRDVWARQLRKDGVSRCSREARRGPCPCRIACLSSVSGLFGPGKEIAD